MRKKNFEDVDYRKTRFLSRAQHRQCNVLYLQMFITNTSHILHRLLSCLGLFSSKDQASCQSLLNMLIVFFKCNHSITILYLGFSFSKSAQPDKMHVYMFVQQCLCDIQYLYKCTDICTAVTIRPWLHIKFVMALGLMHTGRLGLIHEILALWGRRKAQVPHSALMPAFCKTLWETDSCCACMVHKMVLTFGAVLRPGTNAWNTDCLHFKHSSLGMCCCKCQYHSAHHPVEAAVILSQSFSGNGTVGCTKWY